MSKPLKLSKRMQAVANLVTAGNILADVGTDHAYIPIALVQKGKIPKAIAMDIGNGPLARAKENISAYGMEPYIQTRLSDGVKALARGEADTVLIAGMGGELVMRILAEGADICRDAKELILQPQSDIQGVRAFLREHDYRITDEDMVCEDGKFYSVMRAVPAEDGAIRAVSAEQIEQAQQPERTAAAEQAERTEQTGQAEQPERTAAAEQSEWMVTEQSERMQTTCDIYGPILLKNGNPVLRQYLEKQHHTLTHLIQDLQQQEMTSAIEQRIFELREELSYNESAYTILGERKHAGL